MKRDGRCAEKASSLPPADLGDGGTILHARSCRSPSVLGRSPDGGPHQRHLCPAAPETARYRLLPQRLVLAHKLRASMVDRAQPVVAPKREAILPSPDLARSSHRRARTQPRRIDHLPSNSGRQAACAGRSPPTAPPTSAPRNRRRSRRHRTGWSGYAAVPADRPLVDRRSPRPAVDPPNLLQPQRMGVGVYHGRVASPPLSSSFASTAATLTFRSSSASQ